MPQQALSANEEGLLEAAQNGDRSASERLLEPHRAFVSGYVSKRVRGAEDRDDLVQDVFLRAARNLPSFRGDCPISLWLLQIAGNEVKRYYERTIPKYDRSVSLDELGESFSFEAQQPAPSAGPMGHMEDQELVACLVEAVRRACSPDEHRTITMYYSGRTLDETAVLLEINNATARSHFLRGRKKLLALLVRERSELVGGEGGITEAAKKANASDLGLTAEENAALAGAGGTEETLRAACVKIAKHLTIPVGLLLEVLVWISTSR